VTRAGLVAVAWLGVFVALSGPALSGAALSGVAPAESPDPVADTASLLRL